MPSKLQITLPLGPLAWAGIEQRAQDAGTDLATVVTDAVDHYCTQLERERPATRVPRFATRPQEGQTREVVVEFERACLARLEQEAKREGVDVEDLIRHAVMLFLADAEIAARSQGRERRGDPAARHRQAGG